MVVLDKAQIGCIGSMFMLWAIGSVLASVVMFRMMSEKSKCVTEPYAKE